MLCILLNWGNIFSSLKEPFIFPLNFNVLKFHIYFYFLFLFSIWINNLSLI